MIFEVQQGIEGLRATVVPSIEGGVFIIDQHNVVPGEHHERRVGRIELEGLSDQIVELIVSGEAQLTDFLQLNPLTGDVVPTVEVPAIRAEIEPDSTAVNGTWRAIAAFTEELPRA